MVLAVNWTVDRGAARRGGTQRAQVVFPPGAGCRGEHRRGDPGELRVQLRRQAQRAQDEVRVGRRDRFQVGIAAGTDTGQAVHRIAQIAGLSRGAVRQRGADDP
jgi:hypothetical protein